MSDLDERIERAAEALCDPPDRSIDWQPHYAEMPENFKDAVWRKQARDALTAAGLSELLERAEKAERERDQLKREITEHRTTVLNAGVVRVDSRDTPIAQAKQRADERLWRTLVPSWREPAKDALSASGLGQPVPAPEFGPNATVWENPL